MSEKKETWPEYLRYNIVKTALKATNKYPKEMIESGLYSLLKAIDGMVTGQPVGDVYLGLDYVDYDKQVRDYMDLHPQATKEEIDLLFPNPLGKMKKHKRKKRKSKPSNMTTSKSSTSKSSKTKKGENKKKKGKRTRNRRNNYTKRR